MRTRKSTELWFQILVSLLVFSAGVWYIGNNDTRQAPVVQYPPVTGDELPVERVY